MAVTRAKSLLIIVGNPHVLQYDNYWRELLVFCQQRGGYKGTNFVLDLAAAAGEPIANVNERLDELLRELSELSLEQGRMMCFFSPPSFLFFSYPFFIFR